MRLLKFDSCNELMLTKDEPTPLAAYAILSHTWGADDDEVTFDDIEKKTGKNKAGYTKLWFCANQARKDGLDYCWVDTCCINKANHVELSEAITSMFRWYQEAKRCYVYLTDVSVNKAQQDVMRPMWEAAFRKSRWFTRGWTLQELLAPALVEFFSKEEVYLGDRQTLKELIQEITDIPVTALEGESLSTFTINERLRWAEGRHTKKVEDRAYCLLGILEVFIPLMYGERENAYRRLRKEIDSNTGSGFSHKANAPDPSAVISYDRDAVLVERRMMIEHLRTQLLAPESGIALVGLGGVGNLRAMDRRPTDEHRSVTNAINIFDRSEEKDKDARSTKQGVPGRIRLGETRGEVEDTHGSGINNDLSYDDCVQSLSFDTSEERKLNIEKNAAGTCEWFHSSDEYIKWIDQHGLLLIRGQPGCGKSTLLKYAWKKQSESTGLPEVLTISFFFYASGSGLQNGAEGLFRSLLHQMLEQDAETRLNFLELCRRDFPVRGKKDRSMVWSARSLQSAFEEMVSLCSSRRIVRIFVDAVDECNDQDRDQLIRCFHSVTGRAKDCSARLGVCMTSRLHPDGQIVDDLRIRLEERTQDDIRQYIDQELRLPDETARATSEIKQHLRERANGIFLWLDLIIRHIHTLSSQGRTMKMIRSSIDECPQKLDELYEKLLGQIEDADLVEAGKLFQSVCFAERPLSVHELRIAWALSYDDATSLEKYLNEDNSDFIPNEQTMKKRVTHLSKGLVDYIGIKSTTAESSVNFYHESIKEFMCQKGLQILDKRLAGSSGLARTAHLQLANTCLRFLSATEVCTAMIKRETVYLTQCSFYDYASVFWLSHAVEAEKSGFGELVKWPSDETLRAWIHASQHRAQGKKASKQWPKGTTLVHIAAEHGLVGLARRLVGDRRGDVSDKKKQDQTQKRGRFQTTTYSQSYARGSGISSSRAGSRGMSSRPHRQEYLGKMEGMRPITLPRSSGSRGVGRGANLSSRTGGLNQGTRQNPEAKIKAGNPRKASCNNDLDSPNADGDKPMHKAARAGHLQVVTFLWEAGAAAASVNNRGGTPLFYASDGGHLDAVRFLLVRTAEDCIHTATETGWTPLNAAADSGHLEVVKYLHEHGADTDIHSATKDGWTPLNAAADSGHLEVVKYLYEHGADADIHSATNDGWTPLNTAAGNGHLEVVKYLYKHGADTDIHSTTKDGWTPLNVAACSGHLEVVKYLYEHGADINIHTANNNGHTPLSSAANAGHLEVVMYLHKHRADTDIHSAMKNGLTPLNLAAGNGYLEVVKYLYEHGADMDILTADQYGWTPLNVAAGNGHLEVVKYLYKHGADVDIHTANNNGFTPLNSAANAGHLEVVTYLYKHGADIDIHNAARVGWTPLNAAANSGHLAVVKYLYKHGADADIHSATQVSWTPLSAAAESGHLEVVKYLYEHGADTDIHSATKNGLMPLNAAAGSGHLEVVKYLYEHGADVDIHTANNNGFTPLNSAVNADHLKVVMYLYEHGADVDIHTTTQAELTPLNAAAGNGHLEVLKYLYKHGADVDIHSATKNGLTPLHAAAGSGHLEVVKYLYEHGADVDIHTTTQAGSTPLNVAVGNGHLEVVKYLCEHGADLISQAAEEEGWTPLHIASVRGHQDVVEFLYKRGGKTEFPCSVDSGYSPRTMATNNVLETVRFLFETVRHEEMEENDDGSCKVWE